MPRSTTVWAAALVLASFSGSGSVLTTAEAMPAPGPQQTQGRPRYYFPRHVKRQIVTNMTAPAAPTSSSLSSSSSSEKLESRQFPDFKSFVESMFTGPQDSSSSSDQAVKVSEFDPTSTLTSTQEIIVTATPDRSERLSGTGNIQQPPAPVASSSSSPEDVVLSAPPPPPSSSRPESSSDASNASVASSPVSTPSPELPEQQPEDTPAAQIPTFVAPTGVLPSSILQPTSSPALESVIEPQPVIVSSASSAPVVSSSDVDVTVPPTSSLPSAPSGRPAIVPLLGSTGLLPEIIVPATSPGVSSAAVPTGTLPEIVVPPTPAGTNSVVVPTGQFPQIVIPSSSPAVAPTGQIPPFFISSSAAALPSPSPSANEPVGGLLSSLLEPLIQTTGGGLPPSVLQPTQSASSPDAVSSGQSGQRVASTGGLPESESIVLPTPAPVPSVQPSSPDASSFLGPFIVPGSSEVTVSSGVAGPTGSLPPTILQPTSSGLLGGLLSSLLVPLEPTPTAVIGTGSVPVPVVLPTSGAASSDSQPILSLPTSGVVIGITTAFGTGDSASPIPSPTAPILSSGAIPTSESVPASSGLLDLPSVLSSLVSELPGIVPSTGLGPTAPAPTLTPPASISGLLPPVVSSIISDLPSILSSAISDVPPSAIPTILSSILSGVESILPTGSAPIVLPSSVLVSLVPSEALPSSGVFPSSGLLPTSGVLPTGVESSSGVVPTPSETPSITPSDASVTPSATLSLSSGIIPSNSAVPSGSLGSSVSPAPTPSQSQSLSVPASEQMSSTISTGASSTISLTPPTSGNGTMSIAPTSSVAPTPSVAPSTSDSATIPIPIIPSTTSKPSAVISLSATATDSATSLVVGTSIIMEPSTMATPSPTSSGIPSSLPRMIAPPGGMPSEVPQNSFMGQVCFKWPLNYPFVSANDGGAQIFHYLPIAIADGLNISRNDVQNMGLKPLDTTQYQGFITTLALFTVPSDLQTKLAAQLRNPADAFWHNKNSTVNDLTNLINTACPLPAGKLPGDNSAPNEAADPAATSTGGAGDGGALGGDIGASRKVNSTSAIVASSAIVGAFAYGAAMFFVARRYRNKRMAHQRSSSVPSTSRMTNGSIPGGAAAWMHGARNGRLSLGSRGSSSSQGRSIRTQQISAPVMAENSLGWN